MKKRILWWLMLSLVFVLWCSKQNIIVPQVNNSANQFSNIRQDFLSRIINSHDDSKSGLVNDTIWTWCKYPLVALNIDWQWVLRWNAKCIAKNWSDLLERYTISSHYYEKKALTDVSSKVNTFISLLTGQNLTVLKTYIQELNADKQYILFDRNIKLLDVLPYKGWIIWMWHMYLTDDHIATGSDLYQQITNENIIFKYRKFQGDVLLDFQSMVDNPKNWLDVPFTWQTLVTCPLNWKNNRISTDPCYTHLKAWFNWKESDINLQQYFDNFKKSIDTLY